MLKKIEVKLGIKYFPFAIDLDCKENILVMDNFDVILCYFCSVLITGEEKITKTVKIPMNRKLIFFFFGESLRTTAGSLPEWIKVLEG